MTDTIEQTLYQAATQFIETRYPTGWGGAAAVRLANGEILTSVSPEVHNDALALYMEVGALLEAYKREQNVTHSLCLYRESEGADFRVLTPCGICQERLIYWGETVKVAISNPDNALIFTELKKLMPHHWSQVNN